MPIFYFLTKTFYLCVIIIFSLIFLYLYFWSFDYSHYCFVYTIVYDDDDDDDDDYDDVTGLQAMKECPNYEAVWARTGPLLL